MPALHSPSDTAVPTRARNAQATLSSSVFRDGLRGFEASGTHAAGSGPDPEAKNRGWSRRTTHTRPRSRPKCMLCPRSILRARVCRLRPCNSSRSSTSKSSSGRSSRRTFGLGAASGSSHNPTTTACRSQRQDLEERERRGESPLLRGHEAVALIRNGKREVGVLSYGWLLPWEADPTGERLGVLRDALRAHPHLKALFVDQATLYQPPRTEEQDAKFNRALDVMGDLYASAVGTTVLQLKEIPPRPRDYHGILCLRELAEGANEQRIRSVLEERFGAITNCELGVHPGARVTFADHEAAVRAAAAAETTELCAFAFIAWNDRAYDEIDAGGEGRGWCVFEEGVSVELIARLETYPKMKAVLDALPPKVLALSSSAPPKPVAVSADDARVARVTGKIEKATFTGPSDKPLVVGIYREFVERITRVLTSTLKLAAGAPVLELPKMPDSGGEQLLKWHVDCLRVQHASIPDALSGKRIDTREDCVPIAISGKDVEGRPLEGVRDASGLAAWLQGLRGEGALITAEPAAGKTCPKNR